MTTPKPVIRSDQERIVQISGYRIVKLGGGQIEYEDEDPMFTICLLKRWKDQKPSPR